MQAELFIKASEQADWLYKTLQESSGQDGVILLNAVDAVTLTGLNGLGKKMLTLVNRGDSTITLEAGSTEVGAAYRFTNAETIPAYSEIRIVNEEVGWRVITGADAVLAASGITNTPAGGIAATDVQTALNELDTEKASAANFTATPTAAGTTVLTAASTYIQEFTGVTTQTVTLPVVSTLTNKRQFLIINNSSGGLTINSSGANLVYALGAGETILVTAILLTGTSAASWDVAVIGNAILTQTITNGDTSHSPSGDAVNDALALKADLSPTVRNITGATGSITSADNGKIVTVSHGSTSTITVTGPFAVGFNCLVIQIGAGEAAFVEGTDCSIENRQSHTETAGQWAEANFVCHLANTLVLGGDTA